MSSVSANLRAHVRRVLERAGVSSAHALGVACSGGPDSAVLAHVVIGLARQGLVGQVALVHVDHGLRPGSAEDARVVRALADTGDSGAGARVEVICERVHVDRTRASLERAAREARYQVLDRVVRERGLARMLLAHTASDQAETVLMRMLRGTGVVGLAGIPAARGPYLRPLLSVTRADIEAYVAETGIAVVRDPTNRDHGFFRNRVRHQWLPALAAENPNLERALCRIAESAGEERAVLDYAARALLERARAKRAEEEESPDAHAFVTTALVDAPAAVTRRALALAAEAAGGEPLAAGHVRALFALVSRPTHGTLRLDLPRLSAVREYDTLRLSRAADARMEPARPRPQVHVDGPDGPYDVRAWQPGDRMRPARLAGRSRKLSDLYIDAKVPRAERAAARVVVRRSDGEVQWAEYVGPAWGSRVLVRLTEPVAGAMHSLDQPKPTT